MNECIYDVIDLHNNCCDTYGKEKQITGFESSISRSAIEIKRGHSTKAEAIAELVNETHESGP